MPLKDGTGPVGQGIGRGQGNGITAGPGGKCICTKCNNSVPHTRGVPCVNRECPKCGAAMTRE